MSAQGDNGIITQITTEDTEKENTDPATDITDASPASNVVTQCGIELSIPGGHIAKIHYRDNNKNDYDSGYEYYDAGGKLVFEERTKIDGEFSQIYSYEYDDQGRLVKEIKWGVKNIVPDTTTVYEFGDYGPVRTDVYNIDNELKYSLVYEYDSQNRVSKETNIRASDNAVTNFYEYEYEEDGSYTRWFHPNGEDDRNGTYEKYTADGLKTESYRPGNGTANMKSEQTIYEYDSNGRELKEDIYKGDEMQSCVTIEYDDQGRRTYYGLYSASGSLLYEYTYEFEPAD